MKIVKLNEAQRFVNGKNCEVLEYVMEDKDINGAVAKLKGRYPDTGYCVNEKCKELVYVVEGKGTLNKKDESISFEQGDVILIDIGETYFWDANCTVVMPCTPAWYPEQHKIIEE